MEGTKEPALASVPSDATLTRSVTPVRPSWTKISTPPLRLALVSPLTRLVAAIEERKKIRDQILELSKKRRQTSKRIA